MPAEFGCGFLARLQRHDDATKALDDSALADTLVHFLRQIAPQLVFASTQLVNRGFIQAIAASST